MSLTQAITRALSETIARKVLRVLRFLVDEVPLI